MAERRIDSGLVVSAAAHAAVLLWTAVSFAAKPLDMPPAESMPVDIISDTQFSQMMAGAKDAAKKDAPKPLVEKKADPKPAEDVTAKIADKEIVTASSAAAEPPPPPPPDKKAPEAKAKPLEPKPEPEPKKAEKAEPEKKQPDAEALKKDEKKEPPKKEEAKVAPPTPPKKPELKPEPKPEPKVAEPKPAPTPPKKVEPKPQVAEPRPDEPKFNASQIAALLDKRQPQRLAAAGDVVNTTPTLGTRTGNAATLSQNEIDALRARIQQCWNPPAGHAEAKDLVVQVRILFNPDGSLSGEPRLVGRGATSAQQVAAESAMRAVRRCAPYSFMPAAKYDAWKDVEVTFDPRDLFRG